ncbi:hypothetical protein SB659_02905 [Arthrobacter sp. SIMBA_036]|uniref:hypothetical protein n=1 Tax=Arthrobacter sp. SIMBA_036 TaxID=3085778 RepID=UPI00397972D5
MSPYKPMRPNVYSSANAASRPARRTTPPSSLERALRPFGYLLMGLVWSGIGAVTLVLPAALTIGLATSGGDGFGSADFVTDSDPVMLILFGVFVLFVLVPLLGYAFVCLPLAAVPFAVLSFTYMVQSLRPAHATTRLSATGWTNEAIGPVAIIPTALSLLPVRLTPWTRFWAKTALLGWIPGKELFVPGLPIGLASFLVPVWMFAPAAPGVRVIGVVVVAALMVATIALTVRAWRARYRSERFRHVSN